jgi:hypothetical protein
VNISARKAVALRWLLLCQCCSLVFLLTTCTCSERVVCLSLHRVFRAFCCKLQVRRTSSEWLSYCRSRDESVDSLFHILSCDCNSALIHYFILFPVITSALRVLFGPYPILLADCWIIYSRGDDDHSTRAQVFSS